MWLHMRIRLGSVILLVLGLGVIIAAVIPGTILILESTMIVTGLFMILASVCTMRIDDGTKEDNGGSI